jgi:uncharacterized membrane protein YfcA
MLVGTVVGVEIGAQMVMWLERLGRVDQVVRWIYVVLLAVIAWVVFADVAKRKAKERAAKQAGKDIDKLESGLDWGTRLQAIRIPPMVHFKQAGVYCSMWLPICVAIFTGWLAGILGIGGGLIRMPALVYLIGCPTHLAVGTDLFEVAISGLYATASFTYKGRTELLAAVIMLCGAAIGAQIGVVATKYVKGYGIRIVFGTAVIGCLISVLLRQLASVFPDSRAILNNLAAADVLGFVSAISIYIAVKMVEGAKAEIAAKKQAAGN